MLVHAIYRTCKATMHILNILPIFHTVYVDILYPWIKTQALEGNSLHLYVFNHLLYLHAVVYDGAEIKLHCKEKKTAEGVVGHAVIIDLPVHCELHVYVVSHLERDDHSVAPHVVGIGP